ncbi:2Fe-2S ferredoxin PetF-like protein [Thermosynechococcus sp. NK55a]|jgi:ferredoxin|uniref:2Fe-2S iron-sulfur cluster-binding protein n=1 Tax=unclassified Thermosynechococcus TaxID=2622553 RepID=UPI0003D836C5|nr:MULTISPECIES: 2Fe-2S iron-sulfur cluster-binding protein [unclassified Thermosynechococcus]AHB88989.1 2Fe-2S ferredoxin PetF-like protein [Thermosynechococcus sp. NK55a]RMH67815.1 MAG: ferredoxin [Cyanobacteria bacterium J003]
MTQAFRVEILHQGQTYTFEASADKPILQSATAAGIDLPSSCNAGVCTTCAAQIQEGTVDHGDAMGLSPELREKGYVLLCVARPCSDLKLISEKEEEVYHFQFGQFQKA